MAAGPRALIFDFDGVIADSEPVHLRAFQQTLAGIGIRLTAEEYYARYLGFDDHDAIVEALRGAEGEAPPARVEALMQTKAQHFLALLGDAPRIFPGVPAFVWTAAAHVPLAIASGALRDEIDLIVGRAGLRDAFRAIVSAEDVARGKPDPEGFLLAAERLGAFAVGLDAADCLVIEDSLAGIEGARRAGMRCLAVSNSHPAAALGGADRVVGSLEEIGWDELGGLFARA